MMCHEFVETDDRKIDSVQALMDAIADFAESHPGSSVYFRGHEKDSWELIPTVGRKNSYWHAGKAIGIFDKRQERDLLHRFRRYAHAYLGRRPDEWEGLFLARHHGLPVRLLDWTSNPLVALYHATAFGKEAQTDGAMWGLVARPDLTYLDVLKNKTSPLDIRGVRMIYPIAVSPRIMAQCSFFTLHGEPRIPLENQSPRDYHDLSEFDFIKLKRWSVAAMDKAKLLDELSRVSINFQTLYPDLDGLATGLWHTEALRGVPSDCHA